MDRIKMIVKDLRESKIKNFYDLILLEEDGARAVNISIGESEAGNMAVFLDNIPVPRPLTYDIFNDILKKYNVQIKEVVINNFYDGNFYANIVTEHNGEKQSFDIRPSDALNMALRAGCPVFSLPNVIEDAGFDYCKLFFEDTMTPSEETIENIDNLSIFGINMLQDLLKDALAKEDYVTASILRDKINNLNKEEK
ncbi:MAG: bifunctional nuclease family protein [Bacteroidales bacterium]|nr:bifunctional nuclease family protein [Bacteroidales bacterium]